MTAEQLVSQFKDLSNPQQALELQRYFKTGKGEYAEGDVFLGIRVPTIRKYIAGQHTMPLEEMQKLINSPYHEIRLAGFLLLVKKYQRAKLEEQKEQVYRFYLQNASKANNWDLVDMSCRDVVGAHLLSKTDRSILYQLAQSSNLWEQRIAIVSTWTLIKHFDFIDCLHLSEQLFTHKHDLIHKAVGWMLREVGKKNKTVLQDYLEQFATQMPRTSLRYAIERFSPEERAYYLKR